jgi:4-hydroxybenzoate polyprenyltransferase
MWQRLRLYALLVRLHKPIGTLLLLWPTLIALWLAAGGWPGWKLLMIFSIGTLLMRSAGCAINDWADKEFDKHVERTQNRVLTSGKISGREALLVAASLALCAFGLILSLNLLTQSLSILAVLIATSYPFFKRFFALPQAYLGIAFGFGIPMAYAAVQNQVPLEAWVLLCANVAWALAYDTEYALVDIEDDVKIGIRTSAITFGQYAVQWVMFFYAVFLALVAWVGAEHGLKWPFYAGLLAATACAIYHYFLICQRDRAGCFKAFNHNNWLGACVFAGVALGF